MGRKKKRKLNQKRYLIQDTVVTEAEEKKDSLEIKDVARPEKRMEELEEIMEKYRGK